jgi:hypothetical protein
MIAWRCRWLGNGTAMAGGNAECGAGAADYPSSRAAPPHDLVIVCNVAGSWRGGHTAVTPASYGLGGQPDALGSQEPGSQEPMPAQGRLRSSAV